MHFVVVGRRRVLDDAQRERKLDDERRQTALGVGDVAQRERRLDGTARRDGATRHVDASAALAVDAHAARRHIAIEFVDRLSARQLLPLSDLAQNATRVSSVLTE